MLHAMLQREEQRVMRALVKQAALLEESGALRPELCRRFLRAYSAQAGGLLWERFQGFVQAADAELRKAGLVRELGVLHGSLHAFVQVQWDLARTRQAMRRAAARLALEQVKVSMRAASVQLDARMELLALRRLKTRCDIAELVVTR